MKHVPCWKHGECMESFLMEWVGQWYLNHLYSLHQLVILAGQKLHLLLLQNVQIVFHQIAGGEHDLKGLEECGVDTFCSTTKGDWI